MWKATASCIRNHNQPLSSSSVRAEHLSPGRPRHYSANGGMEPGNFIADERMKRDMVYWHGLYGSLFLKVASFTEPAGFYTGKCYWPKVVDKSWNYDVFLLLLLFQTAFTLEKNRLFVIFFQFCCCILILSTHPRDVFTLFWQEDVIIKSLLSADNRPCWCFISSSGNLFHIM